GRSIWQPVVEGGAAVRGLHEVDVAPSRALELVAQAHGEGVGLRLGVEVRRLRRGDPVPVALRRPVGEHEHSVVCDLLAFGERQAAAARVRLPGDEDEYLARRVRRLLTRRLIFRRLVVRGLLPGRWVVAWRRESDSELARGRGAEEASSGEGEGRLGRDRQRVAVGTGDVE